MAALNKTGGLPASKEVQDAWWGAGIGVRHGTWKLLCVRNWASHGFSLNPHSSAFQGDRGSERPEEGPGDSVGFTSV